MVLFLALALPACAQSDHATVVLRGAASAAYFIEEAGAAAPLSPPGDTVQLRLVFDSNGKASVPLLLRTNASGFLLRVRLLEGEIAGLEVAPAKPAGGGASLAPGAAAGFLPSPSLSATQGELARGTRISARGRLYSLDNALLTTLQASGPAAAHAVIELRIGPP